MPLPLPPQNYRLLADNGKRNAAKTHYRSPLDWAREVRRMHACPAHACTHKRPTLPSVPYNAAWGTASHCEGCATPACRASHVHAPWHAPPPHPTPCRPIRPLSQSKAHMGLGGSHQQLSANLRHASNTLQVGGMRAEGAPHAGAQPVHCVMQALSPCALALGRQPPHPARRAPLAASGS